MDARKIKGTLWLGDLFSFDVIDDDKRYNFENLFQQYENNIETSTKRILSSLPVVGEDIKTETRRLFDYKFLNFVRNPYSIKNVLNTFPRLRKLRPTDPFHLTHFNRVLQGRKPHQQHLCQQLIISDDVYSDWLSVLFLLLTDFVGNERSMMKEVTDEMFQNPNHIVFVWIYTYDNETCLLSDRGYSIPVSPNEHFAMDFNLCSHGFIRYFIGDVNVLTPLCFSKELVAQFKTVPRSLTVTHISNDLAALEQYNQHVVYQCHQKVFNARRECYGIEC